MKHIKKIAATVLSLVMLLSILAACGEQTPKQRTAEDVAKDAVSIVETNLTEEEMRTAINSYAAELTKALVGSSAVAQFIDKDGSIALVVQAEGIEESQELMKFGSVKEAFSYFVYTGQMDADGEKITPPEVQTATGNNPENSDSESGKSASEVSGESALDN